MGGAEQHNLFFTENQHAPDGISNHAHRHHRLFVHHGGGHTPYAAVADSQRHRRAGLRALPGAARPDRRGETLPRGLSEPAQLT